MVDISTFGSILLHLRDPFLALQVALRLTRKTVVITDRLPRFYAIRKTASLLVKFINRGRSTMVFSPQSSKKTTVDSWWEVNPEIIANFIKILGFEDVQVTYHKKFFEPTKKYALLFTIVGKRTKPIEKPAVGIY